MSVLLKRPCSSLLQLFGFLLFLSCSSFSSSERAFFYRTHPLSFFYALLQQSGEVDTYEASGHLTVESPQQGFRGYARIYYRRPDSLMVQIQAGFGVSVGSMLVVGNHVQLYNIRDRILYHSVGEDVPLKDLIGMNLHASNLFEATLGLPRPLSVDPLAADDSLDYQLVGKEFHYRLYSVAGEKHYLASPDQQAFLSYILITPVTHDTTVCSFKQFRRFGRVVLPRNIQVTRYSHRERLSLFYTRIRVNQKLPRNRFRLQVPGNVEIIDLTHANHE